MNDQDRFIWNVASPYMPAQAETWGWPDVEIEEIRLDRDTSYERFIAGLGKAIEPATVPFTEHQPRMAPVRRSDLRSAAHPAVRLRPGADLSTARPRSWWSAARADFVTRLRHGLDAAWASPGRSWCREECAGLPARPRGRRKRAVRRAAAARPSMFIFEFGLATQTASEPVRAGRAAWRRSTRSGSKVVERLFQRAASTEAETRPEGRAHAAPLHRRQRHLQQVLARPSPTMSAPTSIPFCSQVLAGLPREDESLKGKVLRFRGRHAPVKRRPATMRTCSRQRLASCRAGSSRAPASTCSMNSEQRQLVARGWLRPRRAPARRPAARQRQEASRCGWSAKRG